VSDTPLVRPSVFTISAATGFGPEFSHRYQKALGELKCVYRDEQAYVALAETSGGQVSYEVNATAPHDRPGELIVGTSVVYPGKVGDEFAMTRGHIHQIHDRAEMYYCLAGHGVMLLETLGGETQALEMRAGQGVYVPGGWIHRSVNVGSETLVTLFTYAADAGQDYSVIERSRGMAKLVVDDGQGSWWLRDNADYAPRAER
jgi:glucose-6-phosphate isomerase, archaeal